MIPSSDEHDPDAGDRLDQNVLIVAPEGGTDADVLVVKGLLGILIPRGRLRRRTVNPEIDRIDFFQLHTITTFSPPVILQHRLSPEFCLYFSVVF